MDAINAVSITQELRVTDIGGFKDVPMNHALASAAQQLVGEDEIDA